MYYLHYYFGKYFLMVIMTLSPIFVTWLFFKIKISAWRSGSFSCMQPWVLKRCYRSSARTKIYTMQHNRNMCFNFLAKVKFFNIEILEMVIISQKPALVLLNTSPSLDIRSKWSRFSEIKKKRKIWCFPGR